MNITPLDHKEKALLRLADQLDIWAAQSKSGGWSTHQVKPQKDLAAKIRNVVLTGRYEEL